MLWNRILVDRKSHPPLPIHAPGNPDIPITGQIESPAHTTTTAWSAQAPAYKECRCLYQYDQNLSALWRSPRKREVCPRYHQQLSPHYRALLAVTQHDQKTGRQSESAPCFRQACEIIKTIDFFVRDTLLSIISAIKINCLSRKHSKFQIKSRVFCLLNSMLPEHPPIFKELTVSAPVGSDKSRCFFPSLILQSLLQSSFLSF